MHLLSFDNSNITVNLNDEVLEVVDIKFTRSFIKGHIVEIILKGEED